MISPEQIAELSLKVGVIYKFDAPELIETDVPHYFIVIGINGDDNYLFICTTQLENRLDYFNRNAIDPNTLAYLRPSDHNGLTTDTYVDCNKYFELDKKQLIEKIKSKKFQITGNLIEEEYNLLLQAIECSETFDLPKTVLKFSF